MFKATISTLKDYIGGIQGKLNSEIYNSLILLGFQNFNCPKYHLDGL